MPFVLFAWPLFPLTALYLDLEKLLATCRLRQPIYQASSSIVPYALVDLLRRLSL